VVVVICALCDAPSKIAQEVHSILVDVFRCFGCQWTILVCFAASDAVPGVGLLDWANMLLFRNC